MNDVDFPVDRVLDGIEAAAAAGLEPIKVNMVVKRGVNEQSVVPMARYFRGRGPILRIIEYMDVGHSNGWKMDDVVSAGEVIRMIDAEMPLEAIDPNYLGEVANRYRYKDGGGEVGLIASVTQPFCSSCTRARLSSEGTLFTCLFGTQGTDFRAPLREGKSDDELAELLRSVWRVREDRYSEIRTAATPDLPKVEMSYIGG
jgi:cyclic pyranopterin phosphate synthase